jgi:predicted Holliday junction resolvase-like endonuclease
LRSAFFFKPASTAIEDMHQVELETWTLEAAGEIRKDPVNRSRSMLKGKIAEQLARCFPGSCLIPRLPGLSALPWIPLSLTV